MRVRRSFAANTPTVVADRQKLRQLFLNLLTNALDAMTHGGALSFTVRAETGGAAEADEMT